MTSRFHHGIGLLLLAILLSMAGCSSTQKGSSSARSGGYYKDDGPGMSIPGNLHAIPNANPKIEKHAAANLRPYTVFGKRYVPQSSEQPFRQTGTASWYGKKFHGRRTANGEIYDMYAMTAAHPTLPLPSYAKVTRPRTGQSVIVRINDRGPFHSSRVIDLSYVAAAKLGLIEPGSGTVIIEAITNEDIRSGRYQSNHADVVAHANPSLDTAVSEVPDALELLAKAQLENSMDDTAMWSSDAGSQRIVPEEAPATQFGTVNTASSSGLPRIYLQFGAFSAQQNATALAEQINNKTRAVEYRNAYIEPTNDLYRVQIGPYESRTEAINAALRIEQETGLPASLAVR